MCDSRDGQLVQSGCSVLVDMLEVARKVADVSVMLHVWMVVLHVFGDDGAGFVVWYKRAVFWLILATVLQYGVKLARRGALEGLC